MSRPVMGRKTNLDSMWSVSPPVSFLVERTTRIVRPKGRFLLASSCGPCDLPESPSGVCVLVCSSALPGTVLLHKLKRRFACTCSYFPWYFSFRYIVTFRSPTRNGARGSLSPSGAPIRYLGRRGRPIIRLAIFPTSPSFLYPFFCSFLHLTTYPSTRHQYYSFSEAELYPRQHILYHIPRRIRLIAQHAFHREVGPVSALSPVPHCLRGSAKLLREVSAPKGGKLRREEAKPAKTFLRHPAQRPRTTAQAVERHTHPTTQRHAWEIPANSALSDICKIIFAIILPPLGVFLEVGCGASLCINICLTILGTFFPPDDPKAPAKTPLRPRKKGRFAPCASRSFRGNTLVPSHTNHWLREADRRNPQATSPASSTPCTSSSNSRAGQPPDETCTPPTRNARPATTMN